MTLRIYTKSILIAALFSISLGGVLLHIRIHSISNNTANIIPLIAGILSVIVVPVLFSVKKTVQYGYVLNGMLAIIGTVLMTHFSIANWPQPATFATVMVQTMLSDNLILWTNFFIGKALFDLETFGYIEDKEKKGVTYRYPNLGWWLVHLTAISIVYTLGHMLWRSL
jgi:hypothetical protein